jgi:arylsulfatase A-like enzyme
MGGREQACHPEAGRPRSVRRAVVWAAIAGLVYFSYTASVACRRQETPPNILLISLDACRADHLSAYGYARETSPFMESLAARGTLFVNAFATAHSTLQSHTTMLSSLYQETHRVGHTEEPGFATRRIPEEVTLLPEVLQRNGYTTIGVTDGGWMRGVFGFARGFTSFEDRAKKGVGAGRLVELVKSHAQDNKPVFAFLHTYYIHSPYAPPQRYRRLWGEFRGRFGASSGNLLAINAGELSPTDDDVLFIQAMYDGSIRFTDDALRRMFGELERLGFFGNHLVVITADHGEELGERGGFLHRDLLYDELLRVPLILEGRSVPRGRRDPSLASVVDITPTILAWAGIQTNLDFEGRDLLSAPAPDAVFAQCAGQRYAIRTKDWKLILNTRPYSTELYDLLRDPSERQNLASEMPDRAKTLEGRLMRWKEGLRSLEQAGSTDVQITEDAAEQLRALGYLE